MNNGFIFAVTGPDYTGLARQAAATVAHHNPDIPIDLYTDQPCDDPVFAQVHQLTDNGPRPRFEALLRSRFDRSLYLDADLFVIAPLGDVFEVLERFDVAAVHDQRDNLANHTLAPHTKPIPAGFPQYNGGVIGIRKSETTDAFLRRWQSEFEASDSGIDQPILREVLFDSELRIATLPVQYNVIDPDLIRGFDSRTIAPRILHSSLLREGYKRTTDTSQTPEELYGAPFMAFVRAWQEADSTLNRRRHPAPVPSFADTHPGQKVHPQNDFAMRYRRNSRLRRWWAELKVPFIDT